MFKISYLYLEFKRSSKIFFKTSCLLFYKREIFWSLFPLSLYASKNNCFDIVGNCFAFPSNIFPFIRLPPVKASAVQTGQWPCTRWAGHLLSCTKWLLGVLKAAAVQSGQAPDELCHWYTVVQKMAARVAEIWLCSKWTGPLSSAKNSRERRWKLLMYSACYKRPGKCPSGPRGRQTLASERGGERGTEDRERGVGSKIFLAQLITKGRG